MATTTYLRQSNGALTEVRTVETSAGAGDASKIPNLNAAGVLDLTVTNGKVGNSGAGDSGKLVARDTTGRIDITDMPVGIAAEAVTVTATETIAAGAFCNLYNSSGLKVRNADASNGRVANAFALAGIANAGSGVVYLEGVNTQLSSLTVGAVQYLSTTPGAPTATAPSTAGQIVQVLGTALSATSASFEPSQPITLA